MSTYTIEQYVTERTLENLVDELNSICIEVKDFPEVKFLIQKTINGIKFLRKYYPHSDYVRLGNILFGTEVTINFPDLKECI